MLGAMDERGCGRSLELDLVRELLFPALSREEGEARVDAALVGARDEERWARIEALAEQDET
jgi:hypothetical protein